MYYIISLKHTNKYDPVITFWRADSKGYAIFHDEFGKYSKGDIKMMIERGEEGIKAVDVTVVDNWPLFTTASYEGKERLVVPNTTAARNILQISLPKMKAPYPTVAGLDILKPLKYF